MICAISLSMPKETLVTIYSVCDTYSGLIYIYKIHKKFTAFISELVL